MLSATPLDGGTYVAVDIETTGSRPGIHSIIEIGAVRIEGGQVIAVFEALVAPNDPVPPAIEALTGITREVLLGAVPLSEALEEFRAFAHGAVLIAHNHRFDLGFLDYESELRWGVPFPRPVLDTLALAHRLHPEEDRHNLRDLAARYGTSGVPTHRALADARAAGEVFLRMVPALAARGVRTASDVAAFCGMTGQGALARALPLTTRLPDTSGVYVFRDADNRVVHVGRAKNLRLKVRSHFYATGGGGGHAGVGTGVAAVGWIPCDSDLDALLLESRLVTRYRPPRNALVLRGDKGGWNIHLDTGVRFPSLKAVSRPTRRGRLIGPFTNRASLEAVLDQLRLSFGLRRCTRRMTRDLSSRPCVFRDDGTCPRPCVGDIEPAEYAERIARALAVFEGGSAEWRADLVHRMEQAATSTSFEDAIRYRDTLRALDRSLSALATVRAASASRGSVIIEAADGRVTLHFIRHGYLLRTLRLEGADIGAPRTRERIASVLRRGYADDAGPTDPTEFTPRQLRDVFVIDSYRSQHAPVEIVFGETPLDSLNAVVKAAGGPVRLFRKTHAAPSTSPGS